ncbi:hypothetical protein [Corynebacterium striatum]|uniref:hypothetical protein n=1 Tax=Corynebacterium striatum TaxID=43770 RepID=UPI000D771EAC|nr:hypothetical protein [Corynebacterium striatum]PXY04614.1 hypothetical protein CKF53_09295 [Corynebacterium striatum]
MGWKPQNENDFPTLGWQAIDWMTAYLAKPDAPEYEPFIPTAEQEDFILRYYQLDPTTGRRVIHRGVISRPRGWGKSPFAGAFCALEALGPVLFAGWDSYGQPVGMPWSERRTPLVQIAAVSEDQTKNTWAALMEMMDTDQLFDDYPGLELLGGFINLPRGQIRPISASASSVKGARAVFSVMDQTEVWTASNGGDKLALIMRSNAAKLGGSTLETPNAFIPGENSVAEKSAAYWSTIVNGEAKDEGLLFDHREAPANTDMSDKDSLIKGLRIAYGDSADVAGGCVIHDPPCKSGWVDLERIVSTIWDPSTDPQVSRSDFLNQITHASDSYLSQVDVRAVRDDSKQLQDGDVIVLGFDGSGGRRRGNPDATALVAARPADKHICEIKIWEKGPNDTQDWQPNLLDIQATIDDCFRRYNVIGFYADPSGWQSQVAEWEARYRRQLRVRASRNSPIAAWPRAKTSSVSEWVENFRQAIMLEEVSIGASPHLVRHLLNARRRATRTGYLLYKAYPDSPDKIDGTYAAMLAFRAMTEAVSAGWGQPRERTEKRKIGVL